MSALEWAIGGWLLLNLVLVIALMKRRSRPAIREKLFQWVIDERRLSLPSNQGDEADYRSDVEAHHRGSMITAKFLAALIVIGFLVVGSVVFVSHHPRAMSACASSCN